MTEDRGNEDPSVNFAFSLHGKYNLPMKVDAGCPKYDGQEKDDNYKR